MSEHATAGTTLASEIISGVEAILLEAERTSQPLEVDPCRRQLFELFVTAEAGGFLDEDAEPDLTADGLCRALAERWRLDEATRDSYKQQTQSAAGRTAAGPTLAGMLQSLGAEQQSKMRLLWSMLRMWMEWTYAWRRWPEFHGGEST